MGNLSQFIETLETQDKWYVLDTETTGLHEGEICQIAIIDNSGHVAMNEFVHTKNPIPADATAVHGITDAMVAEAPTWQELQPKIQSLLDGHCVVVYNAVYDRRMMHQSAEAWGMEYYAWKEHSVYLCAMEAFAEMYGDWDSYHRSYRWQTLSHAACYIGIDVIDAHNALGDCLMTLAVAEYLLENKREIE